MPPTLRTSDKVRISYAGRTVSGTVLVASANSQSLMLEFEALLGGYVGTMPVLWEDGEYRDLIESQVVRIRPESVIMPASEPGSIVGDTVNCYHKRGGCKCLEKAIALAEQTGKPVYIATESGKLKLENGILGSDESG